VLNWGKGKGNQGNNDKQRFCVFGGSFKRFHLYQVQKVSPLSGTKGSTFAKGETF
jgi:hypothetical protein